MTVQVDTNLLIAAMDRTHPFAGRVEVLLLRNATLACSAFAWTEFHSRPVPRALTELLERVLAGGVLSFGKAEAEFAAHLFRTLGGPRRLRFDCCIAAQAILAGHPLATANESDFQPFIPHGLRLFQS